jgi:hypothetical protein
MTIEERLNQFTHKANDTKQAYDEAGEYREIAMANLSMGNDYIEDVPKLAEALRIAEEVIKYYAAEHVEDCMWDWRGVSRAREALTKIEDILK